MVWIQLVGVVCPKMICMQIDRQTEREREFRSLASEVIEDLNENRGGGTPRMRVERIRMNTVQVTLRERERELVERSEDDPMGSGWEIIDRMHKPKSEPTLGGRLVRGIKKKKNSVET